MMGSATLSGTKLFLPALLLSAGLHAAEAHTPKVPATLESGGCSYIKGSRYQQKGSVTVAELFANRERYAGKKVRVENATFASAVKP